jgi:hypothetical protein
VFDWRADFGNVMLRPRARLVEDLRKAELDAHGPRLPWPMPQARPRCRRENANEPLIGRADNLAMDTIGAVIDRLCQNVALFGIARLFVILMVLCTRYWPAAFRTAPPAPEH